MPARAGALLLLGLAQCTTIAPFEGPQPAADEHALCYNSHATTPEQLHALAAQACGGSEPRFLAQQTNLSDCPLLVPILVSFGCASG
jgi:hypothetical protein